MDDFAASLMDKRKEQTKLNTKYTEGKAISESQLCTVGRRWCSMSSILKTKNRDFL